MQNRFDVFIHPLTDIKTELLTMGDHVAIDSFVKMSCQVEIGNYVHISSNVTMIGGKSSKVKIGNFVNITCGCRLIAGTDIFDVAGIAGAVIPKECKAPIRNEPIIINDFVTIGTNAIIMPGVNLAEGVIVGAGSVMTRKKTKAWTVYMGCPAKPLKRLCSDEIIRIKKEQGVKLLTKI